ncbi:MAG: S9 family peptidase [Anaerolineales bacterium]|nr:S9 family peptidase [Anaerolineales bacterium]
MSMDYLEQLLNLPDVVTAKLSPDGRWVAFVWYHVHENFDVFVVPSDGSAAPVALTHTPEWTWLVDWTPDSKAVIVQQDHDRDERVMLFKVEIDQPEHMQPLTEDRPDYFLRGGNLHPDGKTLFYGANYDFEGNAPVEPTYIYRHDLESGERQVIARPKAPAYTVPKLSPDGMYVLYARKDRHPSGRQFHLVDVNGEDDREILHLGDEYKISARWLPDSEHILVISDSTDGQLQEHISIGLYHWPSDELRWLVDDPARTVEGAWVSPDGLIVVNEVRDTVHVSTFIDITTDLEMPFPRLPGNLVPLGRTADGAWVGFYYAANRPVELVRFDLDATQPADLVSLTNVWQHTDLKPEQLAAAEDFRWQSVDGMQVQGWLYRADPNPKKAVVYIHGGPTSHSENKLNASIQYFVSQGFNVLDVNYRGSTGFGLAFRERIKEDGWGGREQDDIATGAQALIAAGLAEPGKVGVTGTSYGGYSSWCQITHTPADVVGAAVPICGMTDLVVDYHTTRPDLRPYSEEMIGGTPEAIPEKYHERSPINFVEHIKGKLLIVQGAQDPNVTPENMREVVKRLTLHDIPYDLLVFDDEGHGIYRPQNQAALYRRMADFFNEAFAEARA